MHVHRRVLRHLLVRADGLHIAAIGRAVQDDAAHQCHQQEDPHRDGHTQQVGVVHRAVDVRQVVLQRDGAAVGEIREVRAEDAQRAQRDDEGLDAPLGDEQAVRQAEQRAQHHGEHRAHHHRHQRRARGRASPVDEHDHAARDERGHRAHRQVDAARDDHEAHAHRDDADEGGAREHVHRVVDGGEVAVEQRARDAQQHEADDRAEAVQALGPARLGLAAMRCCHGDGRFRLRWRCLQFRWHER
ncbi:hypothetical protein D3C72_1268970 [compost metagenome]